MTIKFNSIVEDCIVKTAFVETQTSTNGQGPCIDMAGYDNVLFVVQFGAMAGAATVQAERATNAATANLSTIAGATLNAAANDDFQLFMLNVQDVGEQYCGLKITNAGANQKNAWALLYGGKHKAPNTTWNITDQVTYTTVTVAADS